MSKKNSNVQPLKKFLLKDKLVLNIYSDFKSFLNKTVKKKSFIVAVSGGPDSLALVALSEIYRYENRNKIYFVLVDHGIRKNSKKEAILVKRLLKKQKIFLKILKNNKKILKNVQSEARNIRYDLLVDYCKSKSVKFIFTGHHSDDQIETFLIRLSRGSGIQGLSSMRSITKIEHNIKLVRPLLKLKKKDLKYVAKKMFNKFLIDPSNNNIKYLRTKIRNLTNQLEKSGISRDQIIKSIDNLAVTRDTLNMYLKKIIKLSTFRKKNQILINLEILSKETQEIKMKVISHVIQNFSKSYYPPRSKKVSNIVGALKLRKFKLTLGKCILEKSGNSLIVQKEIRKNQ